MLIPCGARRTLIHQRNVLRSRNVWFPTHDNDRLTHESKSEPTGGVLSKAARTRLNRYCFIPQLNLDSLLSSLTPHRQDGKASKNRLNLPHWSLSSDSRAVPNSRRRNPQAYHAFREHSFRSLSDSIAIQHIRWAKYLKVEGAALKAYSFL